MVISMVLYLTSRLDAKRKDAKSRLRMEVFASSMAVSEDCILQQKNVDAKRKIPNLIILMREDR
jgi:hypothetical protein